MDERDNKNMREYLQLIEEKIDRIKKNSLLLQKYNQDAELVTSYSRGIDETVSELERILKDCKDLYEQNQESSWRKSRKTADSFVKKNILLAVSAGQNTEELKRILEELGLTVFWVLEGKKALDAFQFSRSRTFDAILLDTHLTDKDGYLIAKAIRACNKDNASWIPLIALFSEENHEDIRKSKDAGMDGWLCQPYEKEKVKNLLLRLIKNDTRG